MLKIQISGVIATGWLVVLAALPPAWSQAADETKGRPMRDIRYIIVHTAGPKWIEGKSFFEQPGLSEHIDHYRKLLEAGKLAMGGPFPSGPAGGMMIPQQGLSEEEIAAFAQADPAVKNGLLRAEVRAWLVGMKH